MTTRSKIAFLAAPLVCLLCPAHLLGYLAVAAGSGWVAIHHEWLDLAFSLGSIFVIAHLIRKWEAKRGHHHCDHHHKH